jgi:hypothetical protein
MDEINERKMTLATGIIADSPTSNLNIYPRSVLSEVIKQFNNRAHRIKVLGGEMDPFHIDTIGEPAFVTKRLYLNESDMLCAEIEIDDTDAGDALLGKIRSSSRVMARPVMVVPSYIDILKKETTKTDLLEISKINSIVRIQVECDDKPSGSN